MAIKRAKSSFLFRLIRWAWRRMMFNVRHLRGEPSQIAWGGAMGMFVALTPTMGFQTIIALFIATLVKANRIAAVALVWVTNIFTAIPIFYFVCWVGKKILSRHIAYESLQKVQWGDWQSVWHFFKTHMAALWIGAIVLGVLSGGGSVRPAVHYGSLLPDVAREEAAETSGPA